MPSSRITQWQEQISTSFALFLSPFEVAPALLDYFFERTSGAGLARLGISLVT